jgi:hypothetical protein
MQVTDLLNQMGGLQAVARELGVSESQAQNGAAALVPAILGGFKNQAQAQPTGLAGLAGMLGRLGGGSLMDEVLSAEPTNVNHGNDVLGQIFGSKDVSRTVAQNAAGQTGLDPAVLKKMLPMLAMLVAGFMSKQGGAAGAQPAQAAGRQGNDLGGMLGKMLGGQAASPAAGSGRSRGSSLASMLDLDGDGNPLNDILGMVGKLRR